MPHSVYTAVKQTSKHSTDSVQWSPADLPHTNEEIHWTIPYQTLKLYKLSH